MDEKMISNMAKTLNVDSATLRAKAEGVLAEQGSAWLSAGKSESPLVSLGPSLLHHTPPSCTLSLPRSTLARCLASCWR